MNKKLLLFLISTLLFVSVYTQSDCEVSLRIVSKGFLTGDDFQLFENEVEQFVDPLVYQGHLRGIFIATYQAGVRTNYNVYDVHLLQAASNALADFIHAQPAGTYFALGCKDECTMNMNNYAWSALESLGLDTNVRNQLGWRGAFTLFGWSGASPSETVQAMSTEAQGGQTESEDCAFVDNLQYCYDYFGQLSADADSVDNWCDYDTNASDELIYNFHVEYVNGFYYDDECLEHTLDFQGIDLPEGNAPTWEYQFSNNEITFSIPHLDLENSNCILITEPEEYIWQCFMTLHLWYQGVEQYQYDFHMTSYLSRVYENTLEVTVEKNEVVGECCENELQIETILKFCTDMSCSDYLDNGLEVVRKAPIYVEHSIVSAQFQYYYLHHVALTLGPFVPKILATNANLPGKIIYKLQSNIAMDGMVIEAVSRIDENSQNARRRLQEGGEVGEDYKVKSVSEEIKILEEQKDEQIHSELNERTYLIGIAAGLTIALVLLYSMTGVFYIKNKKHFAQKEEQKENKENKYRTQRSNSIDSQV